MRGSSEIVTIDTPTEIDADHTADAAENEPCRESDSCPNPPADQAHDRHAGKNAESVHNLALASGGLGLE